MENFKGIDPKSVYFNPFSVLDDTWMLITAQAGDEVNTMTASWGGFGVLWNKNVAYIFVRPQRYTRELIDQADYFSLNILNHEKYKKDLEYLGSASGRNEDKIEGCSRSLIETMCPICRGGICANLPQTSRQQIAKIVLL